MATISSYNNQLMTDQETENSPENSSDSQRCTVSNDTKIASTSSSKRRRGSDKRVISVPIKDIEGFRVKGDHMSAPPSDSWAWRKYGQKPIKGSPYPRGYYRCSSSKGCPARKQVERSRSDPNLLLVTYSCEHNHSSPASNSRNHHHHHHHSRNSHVLTHSTSTTLTGTAMSMSEEDEEDEDEDYEEEEKKPVIHKDLMNNNNNNKNTQQSQEQEEPEYKFTSLGTEGAGEFGWFDFEPTLYCTMLDQCPILTDDKCVNNTDNEMAMREEDESLFADLGELPECSEVFRLEMAPREVAA